MVPSMQLWSLDAASNAASASLTQGWHDASEGDGDVKFRWSTDYSAKVLIPAPLAGRITIDLHCFPFTAGGQLPAQEVWVWLDGLYVAFDRVDSDRVVSGLLACPTSTSPIRTLSITLPQARSPKDLGIGDDQRRLGIALRSISIIS